MVAWFLAVLASSAVATRADAPIEKSIIKILHPPSGLVLEAPGKVVIEAQAIDPAGDIRHLDFFANDTAIGVSDYLLKIATIPGRPIPHRLEWKDIPAGAYRVVARGTDTVGNQVESDPVEILVRPQVPQGVALVKWGTEWKYSNDGTDLGEAWRAPGFDDSRWPAGLAPLGYGDGDEKTVTRNGEPPHPPTAYFRQSFQVPADLAAKSLLIRLVRDDSAVIYLNGQEVVRDNLPNGVITFSTLASETTDNENGIRTFVIPSTGLSAGNNVLAVEVHQSATTSSDLSFDLELSALDRDGPVDGVKVVGVEATWPQTAEPSPLARVAPGRIKVSRTGDTTFPLAVFLKFGGTAQLGIDYVRPRGLIEIPAGQAETEIFIQAIEDDLLEGTESVVIELQEDPSLSILPRYRIDPDHARAVVEIHDGDRVDKPTIVIQKPADGAVFPFGATIEIEATAVDPNGYIPRVEFYDGDRRIGVSEIVFIVAPPDGSPIRHVLEWKDASLGDHKLTVRAGTDPASMVQSETVLMSVKEHAESSLVITAPEAGASFGPGQPIEIQA
ncbi:MAG: Ig-like domain-containing protein, partial [Nitrospira sp.]|nr:Ig-like domain-containing protein [Nitrospira sp.]